MSPTPEKSVCVKIYGRVQGVWFRAWTAEEATRRGLDGWVRNCHDGTVEAAFAGPADQVDDMIRACHRGPRHARVDKVDVMPAAEIPEGGFRQLRTA
jgi:acylphosphatase